jgi:hypothetical protein
MTSKSQAAAGKDTIYIDVDDEITTIIDKLRSSPGKIVALVLPKRATVFQSIVNMKLLKRTADNAKKHVVLVTSEAALMPLAGTVGLYVAETPQSKPEIPPVPGDDSRDDVIEEGAIDDEPAPAYTAENAGNRPVGELARGTATPATVAGIETLALDNDEEEEAPATGAVTSAKKPTRNKKLKVPNFNKFRLLLAVGVLALIVIIVGLVFALKVLPKAEITIRTDANDVNSDLTLTLDGAAKTLDKSTLTVPAKIAQEQKTQSQQVPATGTKNNGEIAKGSVKLTACIPGFTYPKDVPAGTGVSANGMTYITQDTASFNPVGPDGAHSCYKYSSNSVDIKAQAGGSKYNTGGSANFSVAGRSDTTGTGSADGGTDNIVKVVQQADIDAAKQKISTSSDTNAVKGSLEDDLRIDGLKAITETFDAGEPSVTSTSQVGDQADNVTVTATYTYTMFGVKKSYLDTVVNDDIKSQVDTSKETILTNGIDDAAVRVLEKTATTKKIDFQTTGTVGPDLHIDDIKKEAAGKKSGDVIPTIKNLPGVTDVNVHLSPFWVSKIPGNSDKITVVVKKASDK